MLGIALDQAAAATHPRWTRAARPLAPCMVAFGTCRFPSSHRPAFRQRRQPRRIEPEQPAERLAIRLAERRHGRQRAAPAIRTPPGQRDAPGAPSSCRWTPRAPACASRARSEDPARARGGHAFRAQQRLGQRRDGRFQQRAGDEGAEAGARDAAARQGSRGFPHSAATGSVQAGITPIASLRGFARPISPTRPLLDARGAAEAARGRHHPRAEPALGGGGAGDAGARIREVRAPGPRARPIPWTTTSTRWMRSRRWWMRRRGPGPMSPPMPIRPPPSRARSAAACAPSSTATSSTRPRRASWRSGARSWCRRWSSIGVSCSTRPRSASPPSTSRRRGRCRRPAPARSGSRSARGCAWRSGPTCSARPSSTRPRSCCPTARRPPAAGEGAGATSGSPPSRSRRPARCPPRGTAARGRRASPPRGRRPAALPRSSAPRRCRRRDPRGR